MFLIKERRKIKLHFVFFTFGAKAYLDIYNTLHLQYMNNMNILFLTVVTKQIILVE